MILQKKICMLGSFGVGKTSLVSQFVHSIFSEQYQTTIGVKIDRKPIQINDVNLNMVLWDLAGEDRFDQLQSSYLAGASAYLLVVDGCRRDSFNAALQIQANNQAELANLPFICVLNKADLRADWEIGKEDIEAIEALNWRVAITTAKEAQTVEDVFHQLGELVIQNAPANPVMS